MTTFPAITEYPTREIRQQIDLKIWNDLLDSWIKILQFYDISKTVPTTGIKFLTSYIQESWNNLLQDGSILDGELSQTADSRLRAAVLITFQRLNPSVSSVTIWHFMCLFAGQNTAAAKQIFKDYYKNRGKALVIEIKIHVLDDLAKCRQQTIASNVLPGLAVIFSDANTSKTWVDRKWFSDLEKLFTKKTIQTGQIELTEIAGISLKSLDYTSSLLVIPDIISASSNDSSYHLLSTLLNHTNFLETFAISSLKVSLEAAKLRLPSTPPLRMKAAPTVSSMSSQRSPEEISVIMDLFPQISPQVISQLLPQHHNSAEQLIAYLLENPEMIEGGHETAQSSPSSSQSVIQQSSNRSKPSRTIYSDINPASSGIIFGKKEKIATGRANKKTLETTLRLFYEADDDERDDTYDDVDGGAINDEGLLEEPESVDLAKKLKAGVDTEEPESSSSTSLDHVEEYLWNIYKRSEGDFAQSARKSRSRATMREHTKWSDEQIEGWGRMLTRNPQRKKLLESKFMFKGNSITVPSTSYRKAKEPQDSSNSTENNGHQILSRTAGDGVISETGVIRNPQSVQHQHARKDRNKAKQGNHNRKSAHSRKMEKAGFAG